MYLARNETNMLAWIPFPFLLLLVIIRIRTRCCVID